jgi:hypothetical protein
LSEQIFISHSSKDHKILEFFRQLFDDSGVKPVFMEFESWSRNNMPNWIWIREQIQKSRALFLILTKNIVEKPYTQNWIAFEIGVACSTNPPIPVYVFREEDVKFPVPYLTWYFDEPFSSLDHSRPKDFSEIFLEFFRHILRYTVFVNIVLSEIYNMNKKDDWKETSLTCSKCKLDFNYFGFNSKINCPCCSNDLPVFELEK